MFQRYNQLFWQDVQQTTTVIYAMHHRDTQCIKEWSQRVYIVSVLRVESIFLWRLCVFLYNKCSGVLILKVIPCLMQKITHFLVHFFKIELKYHNIQLSSSFPVPSPPSSFSLGCWLSSSSSSIIIIIWRAKGSKIQLYTNIFHIHNNTLVSKLDFGLNNWTNLDISLLISSNNSQQMKNK